MELNLITPQKVIQKIDEPFYFRGLTHLLCQTWQVSYVEFYCIGLEQQKWRYSCSCLCVRKYGYARI